MKKNVQKAWHSEDVFAKQNLKCQKEEISKLTLSLKDLENKTAKNSAAESKELNALLDTAKLELEESCKALFQAKDELEDTERKLSRASQETEDKYNKSRVISDLNRGLNRKITKLMQTVDQLQEDHELQLAIQHKLTLKTALPEALVANKSEEEMGNQPSQTPKHG